MSNIILFFYVLATSFALITIKLGSKAGAPISYDSGLHFNLNPYAIVGILLYGISFVLYIYLISKNDLGYIIPLTTALVYTLIFIASYFIFHEVFTVMKISGIALILVGVLLISFKK